MSFIQRQRAIARRLSEYRLHYAEDSLLRLDDLESLNIPPEKRGQPYFLAYYSPEGLDYALHEYGIYRELEKRGFSDIRMQLDTEDPYQHRLALYAGEISEERLLHEVVMKRRKFNFDDRLCPSLAGHAFQFLAVEWVCLQNPQASFSQQKRPLPGQTHPGLGMGKFVMALIQISAERLGLDGVLTQPAWLHNAIMYKQAFHFLDPAHEGRLLAMQRDLVNPLGLQAASWALEKDLVLENKQPFRWFHADQLLPLHPLLKSWFKGLSYQIQTRQIQFQVHYQKKNA
ncbi:hypothetical protein COW36_18380 [bacterium (Candidatus Blackallbacteria) CG17_big_fil_post_rev_8_21_14_2_50_48_46]|uniref:Uncharacterized protein n=1 Tax=bacterium (Candidatus Blackallbacteria) CG17_big_fil_post_rev_8_21_14_2_50_48_46 TaxID=2014261 RepID=A0A2M7G100_9BACT|nr:MAG: hypothetical protein COW64_00355 [bacterium (Candidatus Blackallbacteria) CG18_big_fil_WC_8_21_14_2_50_49_26]PIW15384.1 MAG: hypothetical protein COW36_18380 [bacterium (Candidatus Blackallbacteria) CG17_big_fil_post_rev_8_21_14_2_50_48_46]PIW49755.1 MAG: hypothetical protein COW20_04985 [bacterium (Candidatus Blackallbacteria) CG13_big_fil_rev_8_21_14_2_50_49_14]